VVKRWKTGEGETRTKEFKYGYALKAAFEKPKDGRLPGKIYLALPDEEHSFISGTFTAEIRKPPPKKPPAPKPPLTNAPTVKTN
jgi:hypothetical protein